MKAKKQNSSVSEFIIPSKSLINPPFIDYAKPESLRVPQHMSPHIKLYSEIFCHHFAYRDGTLERMVRRQYFRFRLSSAQRRTTHPFPHSAMQPVGSCTEWYNYAVF